MTITPGEIAEDALGFGWGHANWQARAVARYAADQINKANRLHAEARDRANALEEAVTPSIYTKAAYMSEFTIDVNDLCCPNDEPDFRRLYIPWTSIKDVMIGIKNRARSAQDRSTDDD